MKIFLSLYFFMIAIVQMGLFFGIYHYYRSQNLATAKEYWLGSLLISSVGLLLFGVAILGIEDLSQPAFIFTISNSCIYLAGLLQTIFCISLNRAISKRLEIVYLLSFLLFVTCFEFLRHTSTFELRTIFMIFIASIFYNLQFLQVRKFRIKAKSKQLFYLQTVAALELICLVSRLIILLITSFGIKSLEQLPQLLILFTLTQLVTNTLSYIAIAGYKSEKVAYSKAKSDAEKEAAERKLIEISELLKEKERLIYGLMKANKTVATGALSASIAHELSQPLGASNLNIQFLQKKLNQNELSPVLGRQVLDLLARDNDRAATIVRSLQSIFIEGDSNTQEVQLGDLIVKVMDIVKPELKSNLIQIELRVDDDLMIRINPPELQQLILNLLNNAIQSLANSDGKTRRISIEAIRSVQWVQLSIADNGPGVPTEFKPQLFELLHTTKQTGMGLGLWLCKYIISKNGGTISYKDATGGGAIFIVQLPIVV